MEITIDGKRYKLVPIEEETVDEYVGAVETASQSEQYLVGVKKDEDPSVSTGVKVAVPKVSNYRERYKKHQLSLTDLKVPPKIIKEVPKVDAGLEGFNYKGEKLFFGEGIQQEF